MKMTSYAEQYNNYLTFFSRGLDKFLDDIEGHPHCLTDSMKYSVKAGGKRLRPVLAFAAMDACGGDINDIMAPAIAVELIHTYSLIHDDLPAMDDDDYRRGHLTNHKVYGEAMAILAGDALLNLAYEIMFDLSLKGGAYCLCGKILADAAGYRGMVGGQAADVLCENKAEASESELNFIQLNKTSKLIAAPIMMGVTLSGCKNSDVWEEYGKNLGILFQVTDDILDVEGSFKNLGKSIGKDEEEKKLTAVSFYGLNGAKIKAAQLCESCLNLIAQLKIDNAAFFEELTKNLIGRVK